MSALNAETEKEINRVATGRTHDTIKLGQSLGKTNSTIIQQDRKP